MTCVLDRVRSVVVRCVGTLVCVCGRAHNVVVVVMVCTLYVEHQHGKVHDIEQLHHHYAP